MSLANAPVLLIDDDDDLRAPLAQGLALAGLDVSDFAAPEPALARVSRDFPGVLVSDLRMPRTDGMTVLKSVMDIDPALPVVLITGHGDVSLAVEAMRAGAYDFIEKPFAVSVLEATVRRALEKRRLVLENRDLRHAMGALSDIEERIVGRSGVADGLRKLVATIAPTDADVLVLGETGTGKEVVARALHDFSERKAGPYVAINCAALPADIFESELFGHEAGAFTGARDKRIGKLEYANGGTVLLDEIESMPPDLQAKLLRAIETRSVERLGSNKTIQLDIRIIAASKADLAQLAGAGGFREDLYYRLNVVTITVAPLRDRKGDIAPLFHLLAHQARARYRTDYDDPSPAYLASLLTHDWPGNVRELRNLVDRYVLGLDGSVPDTGPVNPETVNPETANPETPYPETGNLAGQIAAFEKSTIEAEIARHNGSLKATYEALGLSRRTLYDKMQRYGLTRQAGDGDAPLSDDAH